MSTRLEHTTGVVVVGLVVAGSSGGGRRRRGGVGSSVAGDWEDNSSVGDWEDNSSVGTTTHSLMTQKQSNVTPGRKMAEQRDMEGFVSPLFNSSFRMHILVQNEPVAFLLGCIFPSFPNVLSDARAILRRRRPDVTDPQVAEAIVTVIRAVSAVPNNAAGPPTPVVPQIIKASNEESSLSGLRPVGFCEVDSAVVAPNPARTIVPPAAARGSDEDSSIRPAPPGADDIGDGLAQEIDSASFLFGSVPSIGSGMQMLLLRAPIPDDSSQRQRLCGGPAVAPAVAAMPTLGGTNSGDSSSTPPPPPSRKKARKGNTRPWGKEDGRDKKDDDNDDTTDTDDRKPAAT